MYFDLADRIAAALRYGHADRVMAVAEECQARYEEIRRGRPRGVWSDGTPVSEEFKRAALAQWQEARDAYYGAPAPQPVMMSASASYGMSPFTEHIFGLD